MEATTLSEARIYVGTYAKYNDGSIEGKWFDLSDFSDKDEFYDACAELHADEEGPEYMFQDETFDMERQLPENGRLPFLFLLNAANSSPEQDK